MGGRCAPVSEKSPPKNARHAPGADVSDLIRLSKRSATRICAPRAGMSTRVQNREDEVLNTVLAMAA
jgi:hypothetical protein